MKIFKDQYIVVTGGAGFIGSCVVKQLNTMGFSNIVIVDQLGTDEKWKNLVGKQFEELVPIDQLFTWLKDRESEIEAFIHLGANSSTVEKDADKLFLNNTQFSIRLAEYALDNDHRFIYASSAATYGDGSKGFSDEHEELEQLEPLNMYGFSKHLFDLWLKRQKALDKVVGLKYFNVFGPNEWHKGRMASAILHLLPQIEKTGKIKLFKSSDPEHFEDGGQMRDFIYVKDAARITSEFLQNDACGIFNVGTGEANTWNDLAKAVFKGVDKQEKIEYIDMPEDLQGKYQNYTSAETEKLREVFKGEFKVTPFEDAVVDYVRNHLVPHRYW